MALLERPQGVLGSHSISFIDGETEAPSGRSRCRDSDSSPSAGAGEGGPLSVPWATLHLTFLICVLIGVV